jgi:phage-related protein
VSAPTPWQSVTAHSVGDVVQAFTDPGTGFFFRCTVAGTTGAVEPFWPTIIGNTVEDGTVTWMAVSIISGDFQAPDPSAIIELFELQLFANIHGVNDIYRFHAGTNLVNNGEVVWKGNPYLRFPVEADGFEYTGQGALPRPKIRISNILGSITAILLSMPNGLEAAKVTRIRTLARYIDGVNFVRNNLLFWSEDITQAVYFANQTTKTSATTITVNSTADPYLGQLAQSLGSVQSRTFSGGVKLKGIGASVGKYIRLFLYSQPVNEVFSLIVGPLTSEYQLFTITRTFVTSTSTGVNFRVDPETNAGQSWSAGQAFDATEWQMNEGASLLTYQRTFNTQNPYGTPDPTAEFPREIYYIDRKSAENREIVEFELASVFDLAGVRAPKRQCIANICQWVYRSSECGYTGTNYFDANNNAVGSASLDVCGKRLSSCQVRFGTNAELPYGSYPGIGSAAS